MLTLILAALAIPVAQNCSAGDVPSYGLPICYRGLTWDVDVAKLESRIQLFGVFAESELSMRRADLDQWYRQVNLVIAVDPAAEYPSYECSGSPAIVTLQQWNDAAMLAHELLHAAQHKVLRGWCEPTDETTAHAIPVGWFNRVTCSNNVCRVDGSRPTQEAAATRAMLEAEGDIFRVPNVNEPRLLP